MIKKKSIIMEIKNWGFSLIAVFFMASLINSRVFATVLVQQSSMENTLYNDQKLILDKLSYSFAQPSRGDIIIFLENEERGTIK
ncbi:S26 family signal peptidase [Clostridium sp. CS001]|uniref:S26 family signal peptidase n=1 Tax=Clostridium sp. CS001 TaxID=2880648 RepID=UPI001CF39790|nr:S26 family signal peptidase [Clostridium sp. CS001]MCB2291520.1 S26 family signal peptidase [Clostridium sp. CS001]